MDFFGFLILWFALPAIFAGFIWMFWRLDRTARQRSQQHRFRWKVDLGLLVSVVVLQTPLFIIGQTHSGWPPTWRGRITLFAQGAWIALMIWRIPRSWRQAKAEAEPDDQRIARSHLPPTLRSQLALLLLPVIALAVVGMVSLARDRAAVEEDARRRATEVAQQVATTLSHSVPNQLSEVEAAGSIWANGGAIDQETIFWPGELPNNDPGRTARGLLTSFQSRYPFLSADILPVRLDDAAPFYSQVPQPPVWFRELPTELVQRWETIRATGLGESGVAISAGPSFDLRQALAQFEERAARREPKQMMRFLRLQLDATKLPRETVASGLLDLIAYAVPDRVETESGLPLGAVAFAEARRLNPTAVLSGDWFRTLRELTLTQPSILTPWLLDQGDEMAHRSGSVEHLRRMSELRLRWNSAERRRALARRLQERITLTPTLVTNLWLRERSDDWFATVQPMIGGTTTSVSNKLSTNTYTLPSARVFPAAVLGYAFFHAVGAGPAINGHMQPNPPSLPAGLKVAFELEGQSLPLPTADWTASPSENAARVLAEVSGEFLQQGQMLGTTNRFDAWPSRPQFTVRMVLADPGALFAAQRRQQWLFGGMILLTAAVAGFGGWQTNRAFQRQLALNEEKSNFVASVSHELRAPLASLRLLAEGLAAGRVTDEAKRREYAGFLVQETRRLGSLVENVLDFGRIEQGRKQYHFEPTDVGRLVTETVKLLGPSAAELGVRLECSFPKAEASAVPGVPLFATGDLRSEFMCDGLALQQALLNLLDNALKHAPTGSVVAVELKQQPNAILRLSVTDSGSGIPPEDHTRIFERFYRRGSELRRETQGVGLGLTIVKHIAEAHGGRVWVESTAGRGATFILELPAQPPTP